MKPAPVAAQRGFTLLELSIVLTLIGVILSGSLVTLTGSIQATQYNKTAERMDAIEKALLSYAIANSRIPCPTDLTLTASGSANYGLEAGASAGGAATGECVTGMTPAANFKSASGAEEGGVPTRALQLPDDYMFDGWGRKFRYAVDPIYTKTAALPVITGGPCSASASAITVNDAAGAARTTAGIYALISHGANGHGAYTSNGVTLNAGSTSADELTNCHCTGAGIYTGTYTPTYVEKVPQYDSGHAGVGAYYFDDIVTFKEGWQMQAPNYPLSSGICASTIYVADVFNYMVRKVAVTTGIITVEAGTLGTPGYTGDGGPATSAELAEPVSVMVDGSGNLYIGDKGNNVIRKVTPGGTISTFAGNGSCCYGGDGGPATSAEIADLFGMTFDSGGNIYIVGTGNNVIRKVTPGGIISTFAGNGTQGYSGDGGAATSAQLYYPYGIAIDSSGNVYIADTYNSVIRKVTPGGTISTVAGNGTTGYSGDGGPATSAQLNYPYGVATDSGGNIYIADSGNSVIRKVTPGGTISTFAGNGTRGYSGDGGPATSAGIGDPFAMTFDSGGTLYFTEPADNVIRKVTPGGTISTFAGNGSGCGGQTDYLGDGCPATSAYLNVPFGLAVSTTR